MLTNCSNFVNVPSIFSDNFHQPQEQHESIVAGEFGRFGCHRSGRAVLRSGIVHDPTSFRVQLAGQQHHPSRL